MIEKNGENVVLCGANKRAKKYYLNPLFDRLPDSVKRELHIMCALFVEDVGGIMTLEFEPDGELIFKTECEEDDFEFDEIGAGQKVKKLRYDKQELLEDISLYYKVVILKQNIKLD